MINETKQNKEKLKHKDEMVAHQVKCSNLQINVFFFFKKAYLICMPLSVNNAAYRCISNPK